MPGNRFPFPNRQSRRLADWDYAQPGGYFITIVTQDRAKVFSVIEKGQAHLTDAEEMVRTEWEKLPGRYEGVELDEFVVMPNHLHAILFISSNIVKSGTETKECVYPGPAIGAIIGAYKSITTLAYIRGVHEHAWLPFPRRLWQRNYYDHIIRPPDELDALRTYVINNPVEWELDEENPARSGIDSV